MSSKSFYCHRDGLLLAPHNEAAQDAIEALPQGVAIEVVAKRRRSAAQLAFYFQLCADIARMLEAEGFEGETPEKVDARLRVGTGHCFVTPLSPSMAMLYGVRHMAVPGRLAFDKLDQAGMNAFMDQVTKLVLTELLPRLPRSEWARRVEMRLIGGDDG